jgi:hypothetical protein
MEQTPRVLWSVERIAAALSPADRPVFAKEWMELLVRWQQRATEQSGTPDGPPPSARVVDEHDLIANWQL